MKVVELSGGVGGALMARGLAGLEDVELTVVVNVGDDETTHGLHISPDIDTVVYTLAGEEGPHGWGRRDDTFAFNEELGRFGVDNSFQLGDRDIALKVYRTARLGSGWPLSRVTAEVAHAFGVAPTILPATDDPLRTEVHVDDGGWISFQEYFVMRGHADTVNDVRFEGSDEAKPSPGVLDAIAEADLLVIAPSNPPLSIWPILSVTGLRDAVAAHPATTAVSPLFGGKALKGPADRVMASLDLPAGNLGVVAAYEGLIDTLVIDSGDRGDVDGLGGLDVIVANTRIKDPEAAAALSERILSR